MADAPATRGSSGGFASTIKAHPIPATVIGAALVAGLYFWWRQRQNAAASAQSASATSSTGTGTMANTGQYGIDYSGELSTIQSELETLQQDQAGANTTTSTGSGSTGSTSTGPVTAPTTAPTVTGSATGSRIVLNASPVDGATSYRWQIAEPNGTLWHDSSTPVPQAVYDVAPMPGAYHFKVLAANSAGQGPWSPVGTVTVRGVASKTGAK